MVLNSELLDFIGNKVLVQKTGYFQGYFVGLLAISDKVYYIRKHHLPHALSFNHCLVLLA
jgi:hypothetical protein